MTQQLNLLDLAKQGDVRAIAALLNQQLQPKGIRVRTNLAQGCLMVIAESADIPEQTFLVDFIRKGITHLKVDAIMRVVIQGRVTGKTMPVWREAFDMRSTTAATEPPEPINSSALVHSGQLDTSKDGNLSVIKVNKDLFNTVLLLGILLVLIANLFAVNKSRPVLWEYKIESINDEVFEPTMHQMGAEGWELASARRAISGESSSNHGLYEVIFKRPATAAQIKESGKKLDAEMEEAKRRLAQSLAKVEIGSVNRSQQAFYLEKTTFATTLQELEAGFKAESKDYTYSLTADSSKSVITATAKTDGLKSYAGGVFLVPQNGEMITAVVVCQSDSPSTTPPAPPQLNGTEPVCSAGLSVAK